MGYLPDEDDEEIRDPALTRVISDIKDYQIIHGNLLKIVRFEEPTRVPSTGVNVSCESTPFPRQMYDHAMALQQSMNELYIHALSDTEWLYSVLAPQIKSEPEGVMAKLWDVYLKCQEAGPVQNVTCGIFRSDYMLHEGTLEGEKIGSETKVNLKQVEMNTFSCAGICHSQHAVRMHRYLNDRRTLEEVCNCSLPVLRLLLEKLPYELINWLNETSRTQALGQVILYPQTTTYQRSCPA